MTGRKRDLAASISSGGDRLLAILPSRTGRRGGFDHFHGFTLGNGLASGEFAPEALLDFVDSSGSGVFALKGDQEKINGAQRRAYY